MEEPVYPRDILGLIESGDLEAAQKLLDGQNEKDGQWHYFQSRLYRKKCWHVEAKKQLELATMLDPDNREYREELDNYDKLIEEATEREGEEEKKKGKKQMGGKFFDGFGEACFQSVCDLCIICPF